MSKLRIPEEQIEFSMKPGVIDLLVVLPKDRVGDKGTVLSAP